MKLASAIVKGGEEVVWVSSRGYVSFVDLAAYYGQRIKPFTMDQLMQDANRFNYCQDLIQRALSDQLVLDTPIDKLLAPVPYPKKILCVGLNYRPHARESQMEIPKYPVLFSKYPNAVVASGDLIHPPQDAREMDYEAELVLIIGRTCAHVTEDTALDYVFGYCNGNDISARDLQFRTGQWLLGKSCDGFAPMGPYVVTTEDIDDPDNLEILGKRNGEIVQHSNTREMIFSCRYLISYISHYMTLYPGDVIFTGTPEGVILGQPIPARNWLKPGETLSVSVEGLGELVNEIGTPQGNTKS